MAGYISGSNNFKGFAGSPQQSPIVKTSTSLIFDNLITSTSANHRNASTIQGAFTMPHLRQSSPLPPTAFGFGTGSGGQNPLTSSQQSISILAKLSEFKPIEAALKSRSPKQLSPSQPLNCLQITGGMNFATRAHVGRIGWGMEKQTSEFSPQRKVLETGLPHQEHIDAGKTHGFLQDRGSTAGLVNNRLVNLAKGTGNRGEPLRGFLLKASKSMNQFDMRSKRELVKVLHLSQQNKRETSIEDENGGKWTKVQRVNGPSYTLVKRVKQLSNQIYGKQAQFKTMHKPVPSMIEEEYSQGSFQRSESESDIQKVQLKVTTGQDEKQGRYRSYDGDNASFKEMNNAHNPMSSTLQPIPYVDYKSSIYTEKAVDAHKILTINGEVNAFQSLERPEHPRVGLRIGNKLPMKESQKLIKPQNSEIIAHKQELEQNYFGSSNRVKNPPIPRYPVQKRIGTGQQKYSQSTAHSPLKQQQQNAFKSATNVTNFEWGNIIGSQKLKVEKDPMMHQSQTNKDEQQSQAQRLSLKSMNPTVLIKNQKEFLIRISSRNSQSRNNSSQRTNSQGTEKQDQSSNLQRFQEQPMKRPEFLTLENKQDAITDLALNEYGIKQSFGKSTCKSQISTAHQAVTPGLILQKPSFLTTTDLNYKNNQSTVTTVPAQMSQHIDISHDIIVKQDLDSPFPKTHSNSIKDEFNGPIPTEEPRIKSALKKNRKKQRLSNSRKQLKTAEQVGLIYEGSNKVKFSQTLTRTGNNSSLKPPLYSNGQNRQESRNNLLSFELSSSHTDINAPTNQDLIDELPKLSYYQKPSRPNSRTVLNHQRRKNEAAQLFAVLQE